MSINSKLFVIVILAIFTNIFEDITIMCFDPTEYHLFTFLLFGSVAVIFNKYDLRERVDFETEFNEDKIVGIIVTFTYIYYLLKTLLIVSSEIVINIYC